MQKKLRRISLAVVFAILAVFVPLLAGGGKEPVITVSAASDFTWNGTVITGYTGSGGAISIPSNATEIGSSAFAGNTKITSVTIPTSVTKIGYGAFRECTALTNVYGAQEVTYIDTRAFYGCTNLVWTNFSKVEVIGSYSFINTGLDSINLPKTVRTISMPAFTCKVTCSSDNPNFTMDGDHVLLSKDKTRMVYFQTYWYDPYVADQLYSVPTSVTTIGTYAFYNCVHLDTITLPSTVTTIEHCAFGYENSENNIGVKDVYFGGSQSTWNTMVKDKTVLVKDMVVHCGYDIRDGVFYKYSGTDKVVNIPDGVTAIAARAFYANTTIEEVYMPLSCTSVGDRAFYECTNLVYGNIGGGVKSIGSYAYNGCTSLEGQFHSNYCESIGQGAFLRCPNLEYMNLSTEMKSITFPCFECDVWVNSYNKNFTAEDGILFSKDKTKLLYYPPNKYDEMAYEQMYNVPKTVTTIGRYAFYKCSYLDTLAFPKYVTTIEDYAFGDSTTSNTFAAKDIYYGGSHTEWNNMVSGKTLPKLSTTTRHFGYEIENYVLTKFTGTDTEINVPYGVTAIGNSAFENNTGITAVYMPLTCKTIGDSAFYGCTKLWDVGIAHVETIENYAFNGCSSLESIFLNYVKSIGMSAFLRCPKLTNLTIPTETTSIKMPCFDSSIYVSSYNTTFKSDDNGNIFSKDGTKLFYFYQGNTDSFYEVPSAVTSIGTYAFHKCANMKTIMIPATVTSLDAYIFGNSASSNTVGIKDVFYGGTKAKWDAMVGSNVELLSGMTLHCGFTVNADGVLTKYSGTDANVTIPSFVTAIGDQAFKNNTSVKTVTIPSTVKSVGSSVFSGCRNLTKVTIPSSITKLGDYMFISCSKLTDVNIPDSVTAIGRNVFHNCTSLKSVTIPNSVKSIGTELFDTCTSLESAVIPDSVTSIGGYTFYGCKNLKSVKLSNSVTSIGNYTFINCSSLTSVTIPEKIKSIGTGAFKGCTALTEITLPAAITSVGDNAFAGCTLLKTFHINTISPKFSSSAVTDTPVETVNYAGTPTQWEYSEMKVAFPSSVKVNCKGLEITRQPKNQSIVVGKSLTLSLDANGSGLTYQWYYKKAGQTSFSLWNGRTHASETVTPNNTWDGIQLYCKVTGSSGSVKSDTVTIRVLSITTQPKSQTVELGKSITLSVKATGSGLTYQWYFKKKGQTSFSEWSGRVNATETVTPNATWDGIQLYCKVTDNAGNSLNSSTATITFGSSGVTITQHPSNVTVAAGSNVTFTVKATGSGLKYQWQYKKKGATSWSDWNGRTTASTTATANATWDGMQVRCKVTDGSGNYVFSNAATVTIVSSTLAITTQPTNQYTVLGKSVTLSVKATGSGLTYQWYFKKKGQSSFSVWNGRTHASETVTPNHTWDGIQLYCLVKDGGGASVKSSTITVSVLSITTQPANVTVAVGANATFTVKATGSGLKYQWQYKKKGAADWSNWGSRTTASTTATANDTWDGMQVRCKVTDGAGNYVFSNAATITIK